MKKTLNQVLSAVLCLGMLVQMLAVIPIAAHAEENVENQLAAENTKQERENATSYPWDGMTDEEFAEWVMAEENLEYIEQILNGDDEAGYEALVNRVEELSDDLYDEVSAYLIPIMFGETTTYEASTYADKFVVCAEKYLLKTASDLGLSGQWCMRYVVQCAREAGVPTSVIPNGMTGAKPAQLLRSGAHIVPMEKRQKGDLIFYYCPLESLPFLHVGIYCGENKVISGNLGGKVDSHSITSFSSCHKTSNGVVYFFVRPNWTDCPKDEIGTYLEKCNITPIPQQDEEPKLKDAGVKAYALPWANEKDGVAQTPSMVLTKSQLVRICTTNEIINPYGNTWYQIISPNEYQFVYKTDLEAAIAGNSAGGSGGGTTPTTKPVTEIKLSVASKTLAPGEQFTITATVSPSDATDKTLTWVSSSSSIASVTNGKVTAKAAGTATITAKNEASGKTATCKVTVTAETPKITFDSFSSKNITSSSARIEAYANNSGVLTMKKQGILYGTSDLSNLSINTEAALTSGTGYKYHMESTGSTYANYSRLQIYYDIGSGKEVNFTLSPSTKYYVRFFVIDSTGKLHLQAEQGTFTTSAAATVHPTGVSLNATSKSIQAGSSFTLAATVSPSNATNKSITWASSDTAVATVSNGVVSAKSAGTTTITATANDGGVSASCKVTVTSATGTNSKITFDTVTSKNVTSSSARIDVYVNNPNGQTMKKQGVIFGTSDLQNINASTEAELSKGSGYTYHVENQVSPYSTYSKLLVYYEIGSGKEINVTLKPSTKYYVRFFIIDSNGTVYLQSNQGTFTTAASSTTSVPVSNITLNASQKTISTGSTFTLTPTVSPSNATNKTLTWASSNTSAATVSSNGVVTAKAAGTTVITATASDGSKCSASCTITVTASQDITFDTPTYKNITATGARIDMYVNNPKILTMKKQGIIYSTNDLSDLNIQSESALTSGAGYEYRMENTGSEYQTYSKLLIYYEIGPNKEINKTLSASTKYFVRFFIIDSKGNVYLQPQQGSFVTKTSSGANSVAVNSISLNENVKTICVGETFSLTSSVNPTNASNTGISWTTSNATVSTRNGSTGIVTGKAAGTAVFTATSTSDSSIKATCVVTVVNHSYAYGVTAKPTTLVAGKLTQTCSKCGESTVISLPVLDTTNYTKSTVAKATCTANGADRYSWKTTTYGTYIFDVSIPMISHTYGYSVTKAPSLTTKGTLTGVCSACGKCITAELPILDETNYVKEIVSQPTLSTEGTAKYSLVNKTYGTIEIPISIPRLTVQSIEIKDLPSKLNYPYGEALDLTNLCVIAKLSNNTSVDVTTEISVFGYNPVLPGKQVVTISYGGKNTSFNVNIAEIASVLVLPKSLTIIEEEAFMGVYAGLVIIPANVSHIGSHAFADSPMLMALSFEGDPKDIEASILEGCSNVIIRCAQGGNVEQWATSLGYTVQYR